MNVKKNRKLSAKTMQRLRYTVLTLIVFAVLFVASLVIYLGCMSPVKAMSANDIQDSNNDAFIGETNIKDNNCSIAQPLVYITGETITNIDTTYDETSEESQTEIEVSEEPAFNDMGVFRLTAYCGCSKCCGKYGANRPVDKDGNTIVYTASGKIASAGYTVAADTKVFPYGSIIYINGHQYEVQDCGGAVKGQHIDIYFNSHEEACEFGVQYANVFVEESH